MKVIRDKIFQGLRDVFDFYENANLDRAYFIKPEYLLNVKIANQLSISNNEFILKLEEPTNTFASSCVKHWKNGLIGNHNPTRKGKIDLAVYSNQTKTGHYPHKPLFPIEIKNINPSKYSLLQDIERNIYYFNINDPNNGNSVLEKAYNVSIEEFKGIKSEELQNKISEIKKKYTNWLNQSNLFSDKIIFEIYYDTLDCKCYSKTDMFDLSEGDSEIDYTDDDYCRIGIIIEILKKEK